MPSKANTAHNLAEEPEKLAKRQKKGVSIVGGQILGTGAEMRRLVASVLPEVQ
jgi:hypothetical protein